MVNRIKNNKKTEVVIDQVGTPTSARALAMFLVWFVDNCETKKIEPGLYNFSNDGVCSWYDFAVEIANAAGNTSCRINPCHSSEFPSPVTRPSYSVLDKTKIKETFDIDIPYWKESMEYCIKRIKASSK